MFVDRLVGWAPGRWIETLKNVSMTEDVFADHFPGCPILPGALVVECFDQAAGLLVGLSHDFARVGRLAALDRATFYRVVRPGDQLRVRVERRGEGWTLATTATVDGARAAAATLAYALEEARPGTPAAERAARLAALARELRQAPLDLVRDGLRA